MQRGGKSPIGWRTFATAAGAIAIFVLVVVAADKMIGNVSYDDFVAALKATPLSLIAAAVGLTALSFLCLSVYDYSALWHIGRRVPFAIVSLTSFCAYAVGNVAGFGPLTGGAVRFRFYSRLGMKPADVARVVAFISAAFGLGLAGVTAIGLLLEARQVATPVGIPAWILVSIGVAILAALGALLAYSMFGSGRIGWRGFSILLPEPRIMLAQFGGTILDVSTSAAVLWVLLPHSDIDFLAFVAIYSVAIGLGVASHVPAGLGVFDAVIVAVIGRTVPIDQVLSALFLFRAIYYGLPLLVAFATMAVLEMKRILPRPPSASHTP